MTKAFSSTSTEMFPEMAKKYAFLAQVRRLEAVSFRSFPSSTTHYDGSWAIRLTGGHPAKRLNSVNPLDPRDYSAMDDRLKAAERRFDSFGRPLVFRQTPLAPPELDALLDTRGWIEFEESIVMLANLQDLDFDGPAKHQPISDVGEWVDSFLALSESTRENKPGFVEVISNINPESGLFVSWQDGKPIAALRCVRDNELVGIFDLATDTEYRNQGHARALLKSALHWAAKQGGRLGWLQVVAENAPAVGLYRSFGFSELYRYSYRQPGSKKFSD